MQQSADFFSEARENQMFVFCPSIVIIVAFFIRPFIYTTGHTGRKNSICFINKKRKNI